MLWLATRLSMPVCMCAVWLNHMQILYHSSLFKSYEQKCKECAQNWVCLLYLGIILYHLLYIIPGLNTKQTGLLCEIPCVVSEKCYSRKYSALSSFHIFTWRGSEGFKTLGPAPEDKRHVNMSWGQRCKLLSEHIGSECYRSPAHSPYYEITI